MFAEPLGFNGDVVAVSFHARHRRHKHKHETFRREAAGDCSCQNRMSSPACCNAAPLGREHKTPRCHRSHFKRRHRSHICTLNAVPDTGDFLLRVGTEAVLLIQNRAVVAPAVVRGWWCCCWNQYVMSIVSRIARIISNSIYSHRRAR